MLTVLDFETSRFPDGSPYRVSAKAISWAAIQECKNIFRYYTDPDFTTTLQETINQTTLLILINGKYDIGWAKRLGIELPEGIRIWDCQLAEYVLSGQTHSFESMDGLCERYGIEGKNGGLEEYWGAGIETANIPLPIVEQYNIGDVNRTLQIYRCQLADPRMTEALKKLILLQGLDMLVLQQMEQNGIRYNCEQSVQMGDDAQKEIDAIKQELQGVINCDYFNLDSGDHLSALLYGGVVTHDVYTPTEMVYKSGPKKGQAYVQNKFQETVRCEFPGIFKPLKRTALKKQGMYSTAEGVLRQLPCRSKMQRAVIGNLLRLGDLSKLVGSFLHALPKLVDTMGWEPNTLHPTYNQCVARTGRLSCSKPNAQQWDEITSKNWISRYD